jgi:hypothetical protein
MPVVATKPPSHPARKPTSRLLGQALAVAIALGAGAGCNKGAVCKDPYITTADRCAKCTPWDDELLARINPTELPYAVRDVILACADLSRPKTASDHTTFVTQEALLDCVGRDPSIDAETKNSLAGWVRESNLMRRADQEAHGAICSANDTAPLSTVPPPSGSTAPGEVIPATPTVPGATSGLDSPVVPIASSASVPTATPVVAAPALPTRPSPPLRPAGGYKPTPARLPSPPAAASDLTL